MDRFGFRHHVAASPLLVQVWASVAVIVHGRRQQLYYEIQVYAEGIYRQRSTFSQEIFRSSSFLERCFRILGHESHQLLLRSETKRPPLSHHHWAPFSVRTTCSVSAWTTHGNARCVEDVTQQDLLKQSKDSHELLEGVATKQTALVKQAQRLVQHGTAASVSHDSAEWEFVLRGNSRRDTEWIMVE